MKTMKIVAGAAVTIALAATAASAADIPRAPYYTAPAPIGAYSWSGPYLGLNLGYQWGYTTNNPTRPSGTAGGIQAGYNWQSGQFVYGGEMDLNLSAAEAVEIFQSLVRNFARAGRLRAQQYPVLWNCRLGLWRRAR
jgi:opacity protein-like surface antigen